MHSIRSSMAFTLLELMISVAILSILMAVAINSIIFYRNKSFCSQTETDAASVAAAISNYFGTPGRKKTPDFSDLKLRLNNPVEIIGANPNVCVTIRVTDISGRCPIDYQASVLGWDSNYVYTLKIK